jgi:hypothetical protein
MKAQPEKAKPGGCEPMSGAPADDLPERWSVPCKTEQVLRLVRGESQEGVSRESQGPAHELERWQRIFVEHGKRRLRTRAEPEERELILARAEIGELMMRLKLAEDLIEQGGITDEWKLRAKGDVESERGAFCMLAKIGKERARRTQSCLRGEASSALIRSVHMSVDDSGVPA